jgi:Tfp pilus assembly protein PilO
MNTEILAILRQRKVILSAGVALVVMLIWLVAIFNPEGHKLAAVNTSVQQAQTEQSALQVRLTRLKAYSKESAVFEALSQRLTAAVPPTSDVYDYITSISNAAAATGMQVSSVDPAPPVTGGNVAVVPVTVGATGTYDQTLAFIKALYALPRLTIITQISVSGGGTGTARSSPLVDQFTLDVLAQPSALVGSSANTSTG